MLQVCNSDLYREWVALIEEEAAVRDLLIFERQLSFTQSKSLKKCTNITQIWNQERKIKEVLIYNFKYQSNEVHISMVANF